MKYFDEDIDWIFTFCKVCWDFRKIVFDKPLNFETKKQSVGKCTKCQSIVNIYLNNAKEYYENLNEENN